MHIVELVTENFMRLQAAQIRPEGHIVEITGANGSGKSSVLQAIWTALRHADHILEKPIREGETSGYVRLDLGRIKVERRFTEANPSGYLSVQTEDGFKASSPQKVLNELIGAIAFDPLLFTRLDAKSQAAELRRVAKLDVDVDALDTDRKRIFDKRTEVNREVASLKAQAQAVEVRDDLPDTEIDIDEMVGELARAGEHNAAIRDAERDRFAERSAIEAMRHAGLEARDRAKTRGREIIATHQRIADLKRQIAELEKQAEELAADETRLEQEANDRAAEADRRAAALDNAPTEAPAPIDVTALQHKITEARTINAAIALRDRRSGLLQQVERRSAEADSLTEEIGRIDEQKASALANAKMPVDGLGFADGIVTLGGIPFSQASKAQQIRVSMAVAMAAQPKLRVVHIQDGSLLDDESLRIVGEMAKEADYQVWIERVDTSGTVGFVIEDGRVKGQEFVSQQKPARGRDEPDDIRGDQQAARPAGQAPEPDDAPPASAPRRDFAAEAAARAQARASAGSDLFNGRA